MGYAQTTESPATAAKGAWLLESDLVSVVHDRQPSEAGLISTRSMFFGNLLLSRGITDRLDLQAGFDGWLQDDPGAGAPTRHGHGDGVLRMKWNFFGKDGECFAVALLPQLRLPLSTEGFGARSCEPGFLLPWSQPLGECCSWGGMIGLDSSSSDQDSWQFSWIGSAYLSRSLSKRLGIYAEWLSSCTLRAPRLPNLQIGLGGTYSLSSALSAELCLYRALNSATPDWNPVLRLSYTF